MKKKDEMEKTLAMADQNDVLSDKQMTDFITKMLGDNFFAKIMASQIITGKIEDEDLVTASQLYPHMFHTTRENVIYNTLAEYGEKLNFPDEKTDLDTQIKQFNRFVDLWLNKLTIDEFIEIGRAITNYLIHQPLHKELFDQVISFSDSSDPAELDFSNIGKENVLRDIDLLIEKAMRCMRDKKPDRHYLPKDIIPLVDSIYTMMILLVIYRELHLLKIATEKGNNDQSVWAKTFKIGIFVGFAFQQKSMPIFKDLLSSVKSSEVISEDWKPTRKLKAKGAKIAFEKWGKGCPLLHDDMAKQIYKKDFTDTEKKARGFTEKSFMRYLKFEAPLHKKFGKGQKKNYKVDDEEIKEIYSKY